MTARCINKQEVFHSHEGKAAEGHSAPGKSPAGLVYAGHYASMPEHQADCHCFTRAVILRPSATSLLQLPAGDVMVKWSLLMLPAFPPPVTQSLL